MTPSPLRTPEDYELFLYTLAERYVSIRSSTLTFSRRGYSLAPTHSFKAAAWSCPY